MAMGRRRKGRQRELFVAASEVRALGNPFHRALNRLLDEHGFDEFAEAACREFYAEKRGRPGIPPGVYFRMPMVGYLEGIGSERGIAWRCADSISLREFLGYGLSKNPPEHSGLSKTRKRLSVEAHAAVFGRVVELLRSSGLPSGRTLGVDSTTLEANAAMRSIVRRDDGKGYEEWLEQVARASGIETPTREDLAKLDRTLWSSQVQTLSQLLAFLRDAAHDPSVLPAGRRGPAQEGAAGPPEAGFAAHLADINSEHRAPQIP
ncbi:MAG: transposase [Gemmatimonadota bacterium]|nr:transposase [Gemmatimonadota bacterium]